MKCKLLFIIGFFFIQITSSIAQNGLVKTYYRNGQVESEMFYVKDALDGAARLYYENGFLKEEKIYMLGKLHGWVKTFYENSAPKEEYYVNDGKLDGIYKTFYNNGGLKSLLKFEDGLFKDKKHFAFDSTLKPPEIMAAEKPTDVKEPSQKLVSNSKKSPVKKNSVQNGTVPPKDLKEFEDEDPFFVVVEENPKPIGGINAIMRKIKYPPLAKQAQVEGEVIIRAFVNEEGYVTFTEVVKGIGLGCDEAAQKAVKETNFLPGRQRGKAVKTQVTIPIKFDL